MKCLFQTLCVENVDWDTELSGKSLNSWNSLLRDLLAIKSIRTPRCYFTRSSPISTHQIHGFSDASEKAYSAVVYLRTEYQDGTVEVNLISSKTRVAPLKRQSIPRLEMLGANILARLVNTILKALSALIDDPEVFLWTDSYTTLCWIINYKTWKQYVQRRVTEIRQLTSEKHWHFCPGELNVVDLPSRGCSATALAENDTWLHGPKFLKDPKDQWPQCPQPTNLETDVALSETVKTRPTVTYSLVNLTDDPLSHARIGLVMECNKYSSVTRLLRVTAFVLRFIRYQRVVVDGVKTEYLPINRGVPQGTVLGPILFSIMINDIRPVQASNLIVKFADDINLGIKVTDDSDASYMETKNNIINWAETNRMELNYKKTWEIVIRGKITRPLPAPLPMIVRKSWLKILGVTFQENPSMWDMHLDELMSKAGSRMYIIRICKYYGFSRKELDLLYHVLFYQY